MDAVHHHTHRSFVRNFLKTTLNVDKEGRSTSHSIPRFEGNTLKPGDIIMVRLDDGFGLAEVSCVSGCTVRANILDRACASPISTVASGDKVFARRVEKGTTHVWQSGTVTACTKSNYITVRLPSGIVDDKIKKKDPKGLQVYKTTTRTWADSLAWSTDNQAGWWVKSDKEGT